MWLHAIIYWIAIVSTLACNIAQCHTPEEIALLSAIFLQLGDSLETILAQDKLINCYSNQHPQVLVRII